MEKGVPVRSVVRALEMLKFINLKGSVSLMEIARAVKLPYPTAVRLVQTLQHEGLIECEPVHKHYRPTSLVQTLAVGHHQQGHLLKVGRPQMIELTREHGWPVHITTAAGAMMVVRDSTYAMTTLTFNNYYPGFALPILACAAGHAHIAFVDDTTREIMLNGLAQTGVRSVCLDMFRSGKLTQRIREDGHATHDRTEHTLNPGKTSSIAVPILEFGQVAGVLSISYFSSAMPLAEAVRRFAGSVQARARVIGQALEALADLSEPGEWAQALAGKPVEAHAA